MARHGITLEPVIERMIDDYRARQRPIPDFNEAVNTLLKKALRGEAKALGGK